MAAEADVLREFLVRLGFDVNKASAKLFDDKVGTASKNILALGAAVATTMAAVSYAVTKISEKLDELYFSSQRISASVGNIQAFGYAISQMGGTAAGATQSLENIARFIRTSPGAIDLIKSLGVRTTNADGSMRDTVEMVTDLGTALRKMPYYQANAYAGVLGIDEKTLMAIRNGTEEFADEYRDLMKRAGLDSTKAAKDAHSFMNELRGMSTAVGVLMEKFTSLLSGKMASRLRALREFFVSNFDRIADAIEMVVGVFSRIVDAVGQLFARGVEVVQGLINWFGNLSPIIWDIAKAVAGVIAGWYALNLAFSASPLGIVLALGAAILALYDDYKTWQEGGKSFIDWAQWKTEVDIVVAVVDTLRDAIKSLFEWLNKVGRYLADSSIGGMLGSITAHVLSFVGNKDAKRAIAMTNGETPPAEGAPAQPRGGKPSASVLPGPAGEPVHSATASGAPRVGPGEVKTNTAKAMQFFVDAGWSKEQSAGIVANLRQESGLNAAAVGDKGSAYGVAQWHPDRQREFARQFGHDIKQSTLDEQLQFVQYELTRGAERKAGDALKATRSADLAAQVISTQYERPADREGEAQKRGEVAVSIAQTTTINVQGGSGADTAERVASAQKDVNQQLVRNTQGAVR